MTTDDDRLPHPQPKATLITKSRLARILALLHFHTVEKKSSSDACLLLRRTTETSKVDTFHGVVDEVS
jgi:hypothetical protein